MRGAGLHVSHGEPYRIEMAAAARDEDGVVGWRVVRVITRDVESVPITERDLTQLEARFQERYDTMTSLPAEERKRMRGDIIARLRRQRAFNRRSSLPPLRDLLVSHDGSFWVERADIASPAALEYERLTSALGIEPPRASRWDLYDAEG